jgi:hypothetical protein
MTKYVTKFGILVIPQTIMNPTIKILISCNMSFFILSMYQIYEKKLIILTEVRIFYIKLPQTSCVH